MDPIVFVGGGEYHYKLLKELPEDLAGQQPLVLIHDQAQVDLKLLTPAQLAAHYWRDYKIDIWSLCQRRGLVFIKDQCMDLSFEDQTLFLKKNGKLKFSKLSFELDYTMHAPGLGFDQPTSLLSSQSLQDLHHELRIFFREVQTHCPRDIRVVLTGFHRRVLDYAYLIQKELTKTCEQVDIDIIPAQDEALWQSCEQKRLQKLLRPLNIHIRDDFQIASIEHHHMLAQDGRDLEFDILIPLSHWRCRPMYAKRLQGERGSLHVNDCLQVPTSSTVFAVAPELTVSDQERELGRLNWLPIDEVVTCLRSQLFASGEMRITDLSRGGKKYLSQAPYLTTDWRGQLKTHDEVSALIQDEVTAQLGTPEVLATYSHCQEALKQALHFESQHMGHPWGRGRKKKSKTLSSSQPALGFRMHSMRGFNWWGGCSQSTEQITTMAFLKSWSQGVEPTHLHFHLVLPRTTSSLRQHLFESSLRIMENLCDEHEVEFEGGTTSDGDHWQLSVTVGGRPSFELATRFRLHDYLLVTRPLGYGALWMSRLHPEFNSKWVEEAVESPMLCAPHELLEFIAEYDPSCLALVEEWGFLYHCLQHLPGQSQLTLNFRQVPRWAGVDKMIDQSLQSPSEDQNWDRLSRFAPFQKNEVSQSNRVLWDSLSQGALVIGVQAEKYPQALGKLKQMGYTQSSLVGCVRPQTKGFKFVLSDWKP